MVLPRQVTFVLRSHTPFGHSTPMVEASACLDMGVFGPSSQIGMCSLIACANTAQSYPWACWVPLSGGRHHCYCCNDQNCPTS